MENAALWRERAKQLRIAAEGVLNPAMKRAMLDMAGSYEREAERAEKYLGPSGGKPSDTPKE